MYIHALPLGVSYPSRPKYFCGHTLAMLEERILPSSLHHG